MLSINNPRFCCDITAKSGVYCSSCSTVGSTIPSEILYVPAASSSDPTKSKSCGTMKFDPLICTNPISCNPSMLGGNVNRSITQNQTSVKYWHLAHPIEANPET